MRMLGQEPRLTADMDGKSECLIQTLDLLAYTLLLKVRGDLLLPPLLISCHEKQATVLGHGCLVEPSLCQVPGMLTRSLSCLRCPVYPKAGLRARRGHVRPLACHCPAVLRGRRHRDGSQVRARRKKHSYP